NNQFVAWAAGHPRETRDHGFEAGCSRMIFLNMAMGTESYERMLAVALEEARYGRLEGGIPIGAALFSKSGKLVSRGHNRRVQQGDPSMHGETDAFRRAGRQKSYRDL